MSLRSIFTTKHTPSIKDAENTAMVEALNRVLAVIEFQVDGTILSANENFCAVMGYRADEIKGKHHQLFVEPHYAQSQEYLAFWTRLRAGEFCQGEYKRIGKNGKEVWIQASYNPIFNDQKDVIKVVKFATDITESKLKTTDYQHQIEAVGRSQAVIEFDLQGNILQANDNFCQTMGYTFDEISGQHHAIFIDEATQNSAAYSEFWSALNSGEPQSGEFKRKAKDGSDVWIQASYNPILDMDGKPFKVVKYATDITQEKLKSADFQGQIEAVGRSQAVIEFDLNGTILSANDNFCKTMGYAPEEIIGKHHRIFLNDNMKNSPDYQSFWQRLNQGEFMSGEFKRFGKSEKEVWIQASYNPILNMNGKPFKVVKYATDITQEKLQHADFQGQIEAIGKSQAVISFDLDGKVLHANDNFCAALGYQASEIIGQHHRLFLSSEESSKPEYKIFWETLKQGKYVSGEFKRLDKQGNEVWIQASYNPILDMNGEPFKVVKYATDITQEKLRNADFQSQMQAVSKAQAVIEFDLQGNILTANDNFCQTLGYSLNEIQGQHHRIFASPEYAESQAYTDFWEQLRAGEFQAGERKTRQ